MSEFPLYSCTVHLLESRGTPPHSPGRPPHRVPGPLRACAPVARQRPEVGVRAELVAAELRAPLVEPPALGGVEPLVAAPARGRPCSASTSSAAAASPRVRRSIGRRAPPSHPPCEPGRSRTRSAPSAAGEVRGGGGREGGGRAGRRRGGGARGWGVRGVVAREHMGGGGTGGGSTGGRADGGRAGDAARPPGSRPGCASRWEERGREGGEGPRRRRRAGAGAGARADDGARAAARRECVRQSRRRRGASIRRRARRHRPREPTCSSPRSPPPNLGGAAPKIGGGDGRRPRPASPVPSAK